MLRDLPLRIPFGNGSGCSKKISWQLLWCWLYNSPYTARCRVTWSVEVCSRQLIARYGRIPFLLCGFFAGTALLCVRVLSERYQEGGQNRPRRQAGQWARSITTARSVSLPRGRRRSEVPNRNAPPHVYLNVPSEAGVPRGPEQRCAAPAWVRGGGLKGSEVFLVFAGAL